MDERTLEMYTQAFESTGLEGSPADEQRKSKGPGTALVLGGVAFIAVIAIVIGVIVFRGSGESQGTEAAEAEHVVGGGGSDSGSYSVPGDGSYFPSVDTTSTTIRTDEPQIQGTSTKTATTMQPPMTATMKMTTTMRTTTTTTTTIAPRKLLCTTRHQSNHDYPPDGLCDILVYDCRGGEIAGTLPAALKNLKTYAMTANRTECGLNVERDDRGKFASELNSGAIKTSLMELWKSKIKHYGTLRTELKPGTKGNHMTGIIKLLAKLRQMQEEMQGSTPMGESYIFWGVSPLSYSSTSKKGNMEKTFRLLLTKARVNIMVYQTTYVRNGSESDTDCVATGPAMWTHARTPSQPTFVDVLTFRNKVKLPAGTMEMLSFTLCGHWVSFRNRSATTSLGDKSNCTQTTVDYIENSVCPGGTMYENYKDSHTVDSESKHHLLSSKDGARVAAYDMVDTIQEKMSMASNQYQYKGGWAVHSLQCGFQSFCQGTKFKGDFPRVQAIRDYMNRTTMGP